MDDNVVIISDSGYIGNINPFRYNVGASFSFINQTKQKLRFYVYSTRMRPLKLRKKPLQASIFLLVLRGYYYDADTKLYYLKTRYYDPEAGRFVSQDGIEYLNGGTIAGITSYNAGARGWDLFGAIARRVLNGCGYWRYYRRFDCGVYLCGSGDWFILGFVVPNWLVFNSSRRTCCGYRNRCSNCSGWVGGSCWYGNYVL